MASHCRQATRSHAGSRSTLWAYTGGNYNLSQGWVHPVESFEYIFWGDWERCVAAEEETLARAGSTGTSRRQCNAAWYSMHPGGMNTQMCDGSAGWVGWDIDMRVFAYMCGVAGEELDRDPVLD
jgi:prepilin-type processing-associated H-X9-DG protein